MKKLLLLIYVDTQDDLLPIVESEGWHTVKDLFRKTGTSYNQHWNGKYVLDQDEKPWKVSAQELEALSTFTDRIVVISNGKYLVSDEITLYRDTDGSAYAVESDIETLLA